jgi:hypothetical protein
VLSAPTATPLSIAVPLSDAAQRGAPFERKVATKAFSLAAEPVRVSVPNLTEYEKRPVTSTLPAASNATPDG